jgi:hypothetical protein
MTTFKLRYANGHTVEGVPATYLPGSRVLVIDQMYGTFTVDTDNEEHNILLIKDANAGSQNDGWMAYLDGELLRGVTIGYTEDVNLLSGDTVDTVDLSESTSTYAPGVAFSYKGYGFQIGERINTVTSPTSDEPYAIQRYDEFEVTTNAGWTKVYVTVNETSDVNVK